MRNLMSARSGLFAVPVLAALMLSCTTAGSPTPGPSQAVSSATATAAITASPPAADRFGYVFFLASFNENGEQRIVVRRERDATPVFELTGIGPAVSADGKRLAYWRTRPTVGDPNGPTTIANDLRVLDVANPSSDRSVLTLPAQSRGGGVVWSNDGQGLLVVTQSRDGTGSVAPPSYDLLMLDLTTSPPSTRSAGPSLSRGFEYLAVAWDRPGLIAAAVVTGEGGYASDYVTWNGSAANPFTRTAIPQEPGATYPGGLLIAGWVQGSDDAKLVMGVQSSRNVARVWPILDITKAEYVRRPAQFAAFWRPGPSAPYGMFIAENQKIDFVTYPATVATTLYTTTGTAGVAAVRPDGSGMLLTAFSFAPPGATMPPPPPSTTATRLVFVDVATRQAVDVASPMTLGVRLHGRGVLLR